LVPHSEESHITPGGYYTTSLGTTALVGSTLEYYST